LLRLNFVSAIPCLCGGEAIAITELVSRFRARDTMDFHPFGSSPHYRGFGHDQKTEPGAFVSDIGGKLEKPVAAVARCAGIYRLRS
jgi:hypothetical protein